MTKEQRDELKIEMNLSLYELTEPRRAADHSGVMEKFVLQFRHRDEHDGETNYDIGFESLHEFDEWFDEEFPMVTNK